MKRLCKLFIFCSWLGTVTNVSAETQRHFINAKIGQYTIDQTDQNLTHTTDEKIESCFLFLWCIDSYRTSSSDISIDKHSDPGLGVEYEWDIHKGFILSGEYLTFENSYNASNDPATEGTITTTLMSAGIKQYFNREGSYRPFIGIAHGLADVEFTGPLAGTLRGYFTVARAGVLYQFGRLGVLFEYLYIKDHGMESTGAGPNQIYDDSYNMDGHAIMLGLRIGIY